MVAAKHEAFMKVHTQAYPSSIKVLMLIPLREGKSRKPGILDVGWSGARTVLGSRGKGWRNNKNVV